jgi:transposase
LHGIGPSGAARLLVEVIDITRFPSKAHFASCNGTAPINASSGAQVRHRLSRAGNRTIIQICARRGSGATFRPASKTAGIAPRCYAVRHPCVSLIAIIRGP